MNLVAVLFKNLRRLGIAWAFVVAPAAFSAPPNILLIIADDCTYRDLEVYGGQAKTPHLNRLSAEGMKFTHCFQAAPMCSPTRHSLYTGLYPVKSGAYPNHTFAHDWVKSIAHYVAPAGYTSHLSGKTHVNPKGVFPFEYSKLAGSNNPDPAAFAAVLRTTTTASLQTSMPCSKLPLASSSRASAYNLSRFSARASSLFPKRAHPDSAAAATRLQAPMRTAEECFMSRVLACAAACCGSRLKL